AEDGIRDLIVTGVQTCALPILFALFGGLGTEPQQAVQDYLNQRKVPQLFVSTGATEFGNFKDHPYTIGWQPDYVAEGTIYGKYRSEEHTSELQSRSDLVCRLLL